MKPASGPPACSAPPLNEVAREGSAWQGTPRRAAADGAAAIDLALHAALARLTGAVSPVALGLAAMDWLVHLALSPGRQQTLFLEAAGSVLRWTEYAGGAALSHLAGPVVPLAQDKRFIDPAWQRWPYNLMSQGFLLQQQWWHRATTAVRGVEPHHSDIVTFCARQVLDWAAPSNFLLTNPVVQDATVRSGGANLLGGACRALHDRWRMLAGTPAPASHAVGRDVAVSEGTVILRNRLIELIQYAPATPAVHAHPILMVPAWIMKYYILDLSPANSLVRYLVERGHTVFMISWKNPDAGDCELGMDDYRSLGVMAALDAIVTATGCETVNALGYCLGGTLLALTAAAMARDGDHRLASLTLLAAQVDFTEPGELSLFIDESEVSYLEASMWERGYLDTRQMAGAFQLLRSNDMIWSRRLRNYLLNLPERTNDLAAWNADATRMPYRMHSEYLRHLFLGNELATGRYQAGGQPVALTDIKLPIFAVGTLTDHVAPWRSVYKLLLLTDTDVTFLLTSGGHNAGVVSPPGTTGRSYQMARHPHDAPYVDAARWLASTPQQEGSWWPEWEAWLQGLAGPMRPAQPLGEGLAPAPGQYVLQR